MTNSDDASQEAKYDEIVSKLEALLQKHKRASPASMATGGGAGTYSASITGAADAPLTASRQYPHPYRNGLYRPGDALASV